MDISSSAKLLLQLATSKGKKAYQKDSFLVE